MRDGQDRETSSEALSFEESFASLQRAVEQLEQGGLSLDAALELFERGMSLAAICQRTLERAELRLTRLVEEHASVFEMFPPEEP